MLVRDCVAAILLTSTRSDGRTFPLAAGLMAFSYHALIAALCSYLPQDSVAIGYGVAGYATASCAISLLGIFGIIVVSIIALWESIHAS